MADAGDPGSAAPEAARSPRLAAAPDRRLRPLLAGPYSGFTTATAPAHLVLPATVCVPVVVKVADSPRRPPAFVLGAHGTAVAVDGECAPSYVEVLLAPLGAYRLLGVPIIELGEQVVDLTMVLGPDGDRMAGRVRDAASWTERFAAVDALLLRRAALGPCPSRELGWAWRRLVATGGRAPIGGLAAELGWSHRRMIGTFRRQIGLAPKAVARLVRFHRVLGRLDARRPPRWERLAAECGYADQSHLVRDFRTFAGTTPTVYMARLRDFSGGNSVQDRFAGRS